MATDGVLEAGGTQADIDRHSPLVSSVDHVPGRHGEGVVPASHHHQVQVAAPRPLLDVETEMSILRQRGQHPNAHQNGSPLAPAGGQHLGPDAADHVGHHLEVRSRDRLEEASLRKEGGMAQEVQVDAVHVVAGQHLLEGLHHEVANLGMGIVDEGPDVARIGRGEALLVTGPAHQKATVISLPLSDLGLGLGVVVNVVHPHRPEDFHPLTAGGLDHQAEIVCALPGQVPQPAGQGLACDRPGVERADRLAGKIKDTVHHGAGRMVGPHRQELLRGRRAVQMQQVVPVVVEDDPTLALHRRLASGLEGIGRLRPCLAAKHPAPPQEGGKAQGDP